MLSKPGKFATSVIFLTMVVIVLTTEMTFGSVLNKIKPDHFENADFSDKIHTVLLRSPAWEFSSPIFELNSDQKLELRFDDLSGHPQTFSYTLVHCDTQWNRSDLQTQEYLTGMGEGSVNESASSVNTTWDYVHYSLVFPMEECMPVLSGNYAIVVYEADDPEKVILTRRFYVIENLVQLSGRVKQAQGELSETSQQVELTINHENLTIQDPIRDLTVVIRQNNRDDNMVIGLKPTFIMQGKIEYSGPDGGIFSGGNEFRTLDIKSMKYQTENIATIDFQNPYYHVFLKPDKSREGSPYFSRKDLNGNYFINQEKARDKHVEADYVYVHFCLEQPYPLPGDVFVTGKLTEWSMTPENKMKYNPDKECYEVIMLLKQGLYDYAFSAWDKSSGRADESPFEGSFYETSNDYEIYVYLHDSRNRYDRLAGYLLLKT